MNIGNQYASTLALINSYVIRLLLKLACVKHLKYIRHFSNIERKRQLITSTLNMCLLHIISQLFDCFILAMLAPKILSSLCKSIIHRVKRMNQHFFFLSSAIKLAPCHPKITLLGRSPGVPARNKILLSSLLQRGLRNWKTIYQKIHMDNEANVTHTKKGKGRGVLKVSNLFFSLKQMPLHFSAILVGKIFCLSWI